MKPLKPTKVASRAPGFRQNQLLLRIRAAEFPKDASQFKLAELQEAGLAAKYKQPPDLPESYFKLFVLLAIQNRELRRQTTRLQVEGEDRREYYSPIRDELRNEPDPLKQAEILFRAEADEARVARTREARKLSDEQDMQELVQAFGRRPWTNRDKRHHPWQAVFWHEPMTVMAYHRATGLTRRTILNVLRRIKATPLNTRHRRNDPGRYGAESNFDVLREWLIRYQKKPEHRRAWLVRTLLKCAHETPDRLEALVGAVMPVFKSLGIENPASSPHFLEYYRKCEARLYPLPSRLPVATSSGISDLVKLYLTSDASVGKSG